MNESKTPQTDLLRQSLEADPEWINLAAWLETKLAKASKDSEMLDWLLLPENMRMRVTDEIDGDWVNNREDILRAMNQDKSNETN